MPWLESIGGAAVAVLVAAWLVTSFAGTERTRARFSWIAATALFAALASLFGGLVRGAWQDEQRLRLVAFGFLLAVFVSGFGVSLVYTLGQLRRRAGAESNDATH